MEAGVTMTPAAITEIMVRKEILTKVNIGTGDTQYQRQFIRGIIPLA
jgi:hypothetical protein